MPGGRGLRAERGGVDHMGAGAVQPRAREGGVRGVHGDDGGRAHAAAGHLRQAYARAEEAL